MMLYRLLFVLGVLAVIYPLVHTAVLIDQPDELPPVALEDVVVASAEIAGRQHPPMHHIDLLQTAAAEGNAVAQNNLAVLYLRSRRMGSSEDARALLEAAVAQGLVQARYNLALIMEHKFDTDPEVIRRQIELLEANVAEGDVHSMVLLARRLYFVNRDAYVTDRAGYILHLLETAAQSGDPDYIYQYGHRIWENFRSDRAADLGQAADLFIESAALGEPRAAYMIGQMLQHRGTADVVEHLMAQGHPISPLHWYDQAAEADMRAAACAYGRYLFREIRMNRPPSETLHEYWVWVSDHLSHIPEATYRRGLRHLDACGSPPVRRSGPSRVFGDVALYRSKMRGTWPSSLGWAGGADETLAILLAFGPDQNRTLARQHLLRARDTHEKDVQTLLNLLED